MEEKNKYKPTRMELTEKGKIKYILSKSETTELGKFTNEDIVKYINVNYIDNYDNDKSGLINDLRAFKTYKYELKKGIENVSIVREMIAFFISLILTMCSSFFIKKFNLYFEDVLVIGLALFLYILIRVLIDLYMISKNSYSSKMVSVSYAIHTLESIKEENYFNPKYSEKKTDKTASDGQDLDDNSKDSPEQNIVQVESIHDKCIFCRLFSRISNRFGKVDEVYNLSYSIADKVNAQKLDSKEIKKYVISKYTNNDDFSPEGLTNDLKIFKHLQDDIELNIEDDEIYSNTLVVLTSIVSTMFLIQLEIISSDAKVLKPIKDLITEDSMSIIFNIAGIIFLFTILYIGISYLSRKGKKSSFSRLIAVKFAVKELESKKKK